MRAYVFMSTAFKFLLLHPYPRVQLMVNIKQPISYFIKQGIVNIMLWLQHTVFLSIQADLHTCMYMYNHIQN